MAPSPQAPFNVSVARRSLKFYLAVFFIFAPMMMLSVTSSAEGHSTAAILTWFILSGGIAVAWAAAFVHNVKLLLVVIPCQLGLIVLFAGRMLPMSIPRLVLTPQPLGRPLGAPGDADRQRNVLTEARTFLETATEGGSILNLDW